MIRLNGLVFDTVVDYCDHEDYANARVVIPERYSLSEDDVAMIRDAKYVEMFAIDRDGKEVIAGRYDFDYFIRDEAAGRGTKFIWRIKEA